MRVLQLSSRLVVFADTALSCVEITPMAFCCCCEVFCRPVTIMVNDDVAMVDVVVNTTMV